jgi:hypothetical protein
MGLLEPKGPNPHETDVNSPRYTEASQASKRATEMGISGDAATLLGRGFEQVFIQSDMEFKTEAGDFAYIGNRVGLVSDVEKDEDGKVLTITVVEDLGALPLDWREDPAGFGYDDNGPSSTTKTTTYAIDPSVAAEVINGGGALLTTGTILICRKRTTDKTTWTPEAQAADLFQKKFEPQPATISLSPSEYTTGATGTFQYTSTIFPENANQDLIWAIEPTAPGVSINQNGLVTVDQNVQDSGTYIITATSQVNPLIFGNAEFIVEI